MTAVGEPLRGGPAPPRSMADLLPAGQWRRLPAAVRERFAADFIAGRTRCYCGRVVSTRLSKFGWLLAQLARLVGSPLPRQGTAGFASVVVTDHPGNRGQVWSRLYHRPAGMPQTIHSVKRFQGPTGLEEYLGFGLAMALAVDADESALRFVSQGYYLVVGERRIPVPGWLSPGVLTVIHEDLGNSAFSFTLRLEHPRLGVLISQHMRFRESAAGSTDGVV